MSESLEKSKASIIPALDGKFYTRFLSSSYNLSNTLTGWRNKIANHALHDWAGPGQLLDVGCGTGFLLSLAQKKGFTVTGVDPSSGMLDQAKQNHSLEKQNLVCAGADDLPFKDEQFSHVIASGSLVYVQNMQKAAEEISRVLKKGGLLRIIDHAKPVEKNLFTPFMSLFSQFSGDILHDYPHYFSQNFRLLSRKTLGRAGYMQCFDFVKLS